MDAFQGCKRSKRRSSSQINYAENQVLDSVFDTAGSNDGVKKKQLKRSNVKGKDKEAIIFKSDSHFAEMFKNLYKLQKSSEFCDLKISTKGGSILVHSPVVFAASPYLHKKFKHDLKPEKVDFVKNLVFQDVPMWAMEKAVMYLYTGSLEILEETVDEFYEHCKTLGLNELIKKLSHKAGKEDTKDIAIKIKIKTKNVEKSKAKLKGIKPVSRKRKVISEIENGRKPKLLKRKNACKESTDSNEVSKTVNVGSKDAIVIKETSENNIEVDENLFSEKSETDNAQFKTITVDSEYNGNTWKSDFEMSGGETDEDFESDQLPEAKKGQSLARTEKMSKNSRNFNAETLNQPVEISKAENMERKNDTSKVTVEDGINAQEESMKEDEGKKEELSTVETGSGGDCDKCGKNFYFLYELTAHKNRCNGGKYHRQRRKCVTCHRSFDTTEEYVNHRNIDKKCIALRQEKLVLRKQKRFEMRRKFGCCACSRKFRRLADQIEHEFLAHEIQYDKEKWPDLYCEYCNYWSMNPWKLRHHKLVSCNKGQEPICDMCGNSYKNEKTLKKHKELMHTDALPMLTCQECGKTLKGEKGLKHHIRLLHKGENLHNQMMCHICSQTYRSASDLTFHLYRVHEQPLPEGFTVFQCDKCDYCHNNKRFYEKHMFLHEDKREWHCEVCSKAFKTKNSLNTHMTVHTANRLPCPFEDCTYKALKNCHLKNHIENQHTQKGEKHEKCHLCDYATFFRGNLIKHQRSVHKLEVVTKHSVEMKAKYKNLKSGQIVGVEKTHQGEFPDNNGRSMSTEVNSGQTLNAEEVCNVSIATEDVYGRSLSTNGEEPNVNNMQIGPFRTYIVPSAMDNNFDENQGHFQDKSVTLTSAQNVPESFMYSLVSGPIISQHSTFQSNTAVYRVPQIDFTLYNQNTPMDQI